jgi:CRP-like cAMP-binding protein
VRSDSNIANWEGVWNVPMSIFGSASDDCCRAVAEHLRPRLLADGEVLFREGDEGTSMFFVNRGTVGVRIQDREVAKLEAGKVEATCRHYLAV